MRICGRKGGREEGREGECTRVYAYVGGREGGREEGREGECTRVYVYVGGREEGKKGGRVYTCICAEYVRVVYAEDMLVMICYMYALYVCLICMPYMYGVCGGHACNDLHAVSMNYTSYMYGIHIRHTYKAYI